MEESVRTYSPLVLAFLGDAVFELAVREMVTLRGNRPVNRLNREKANIVNAHAQAELVKRITPQLTDEEADILRRGRNAHSATTAKNQSIADYRTATGLEALCGYLYLTGQKERLRELLAVGLKQNGTERTGADEEAGENG